jgi:cobalt-zinc-cadmium efflux system membrane fusion protein
MNARFSELLTAALALFLTACGSSNAPQPQASSKEAPSPSNIIEIPADSPKLKQIRSEDVKMARMPTDEFTVPGKIEVNPNRVSKVLLPVAGRIADVKVSFGDAVERNAVLLSVESPDADAASSAYLQAEASVTQATASLTKAQADLERVQDLFKGDAIAKKEVIAAETAVTQAQTALEQAKATQQQSVARLQMLGLKPGGFRQRIEVRAPLSGKITEMNAVAGEFRSDLAAPLMTISDLSSVWISAEVPESSIRLVKIGEPFEVRLAAFPGEVVHSRVARIADSLDPQNRTVKVWAEIANPSGRFRPEMFGEVRHIESLQTVPVVPATAVVQGQNGTVVFQELSAGHFQQIEVQTGKRSADLIPVTKGLKPGDRIVVDGAMLLRGY